MNKLNPKMRVVRVPSYYEYLPFRVIKFFLIKSEILWGLRDFLLGKSWRETKGDVIKHCKHWYSI